MMGPWIIAIGGGYDEDQRDTTDDYRHRGGGMV